MDVLLHFGAVDWHTEVWINNIKIGSHTGGYTPFQFNITPYLYPTREQKLTVRVWDPADKGYQPRGKQVHEPKSIWYTAVTGIWQTVWLEPVSATHITRLKTLPDIDNETIRMEAMVEQPMYGDVLEFRIMQHGDILKSGKTIPGQPLTLHLDQPQLWSPESPFLYSYEVHLLRNGQTIDKVESYFAMRKISTARDAHGIVRLQLNNQDYFSLGTLDQGWWPDGLYTAPSDEALSYDIEMTRKLGFNMIRKHVKVEPARWYMHCDKMGILVWQDMPSGDKTPVWQMWQYFDGAELKRTSESEANYRKEWKNIIDLLYGHPCVVTWIPFNEAWGQFNTVEIANWTKQYDPSRLVLPASGGNHFPVGDILGIHHYPQPNMYLYDAQRPTVQSEFGGIGLALEGHLWEPERNWGYVQFQTIEQVTDKYVEYIESMKKLALAGFSGAVYTQTSDVEIEVNGLMTYDRKRLKMDPERVRKVNLELRNILPR